MNRKFLFVLILLSVLAFNLILTSLPSVKANPDDTSSLIYYLTNMIANINFSATDDMSSLGFETAYYGYTLGNKTAQDLQNILNGISVSNGDGIGGTAKMALLWSAILEKYGVSNDTIIRYALGNMTMLGNGLPITDNYGGYNFQTSQRYMIRAYKYANDTGDSALMAKWNLTTAYNSFQSIVGASAYKCAMWVYNNSASGSNRFYDEFGETIGVYLEFYKLGITEALNEAIVTWNNVNTQRWDDTYQYFHYNDLAPSNTQWECEGGGFLEIITQLYYYSRDIANITRLQTDIINRFIGSLWDSPQFIEPGTQYYVVVHKNTGNTQRRLQNTVMAWAAMLGLYSEYNSTIQGYLQDMMTGYTGYDPAWKLLFNTTGGLYNATEGWAFNQGSDGGLTNRSSALGTALAFHLGIVPLTASLAIPLEETFYEYTWNMLDAQLFQIDLNTKTVKLAIGSTGTVKFLFNSSVTQDFSQTGVWNITFASDWNSITNTERLSGLPTNRKYLVAGEGSLSISSSPIDGIQFQLNSANHATNTTLSIWFGNYTVTFPALVEGGYYFDHWSDGVTNRTRMVSINSTNPIMSLTAYYSLVPVDSVILSFTDTGGAAWMAMPDLHPSSDGFSSARGEAVTIPTAYGGYKLTRVGFILNKTAASVAGNSRVAVYPVSGTSGINATPTETALAYSQYADVNTFAGDWINFTFLNDNQIWLNGSQQLAFAFENPASGTWEHTVWYTKILGSSGYTEGNSFTYTNGSYSLGTYGPTQDFPFQVYGYEASSISVPQAQIDNREVIDGDWVFANTQKIYYFTGSYGVLPSTDYLNVAGLRFSDNRNTMMLFYNHVDGTWNITINPIFDETKIPAQIMSTSCYTTTINATYMNVTWAVTLTSNIFDALNVTLYVYTQSAFGAESGWISGSAAFNIYNIGGTAQYFVSGDTAGHYTGKEAFELYSQDFGTSAEAQMFYTNARHLRLDVALYNDGPWAVTGKYEFGVYYWYNGSWGKFQVYITWMQTCADSNWQYASYNITLKENGQDIIVAPLIGFWDTGSGTSRVWVDMWFNKLNASTVFGVRVTPYYTGMKNNANAWLRWLTGDNWGMMEVGNKTRFLALTDIKDTDGNIISAKDIKMCKWYANVSAGIDDVTKGIIDVTYSYTFTNDFYGVDTPAGPDSVQPAMPSEAGVLGAIWSIVTNVFGGLGSAVANAFFSLWTWFAGAMNAIFGFFGFPHFFTDFMNFLSQAFVWFTTSLGYAVTVMTDFFAFLASFIFKALNWIGTTINTFITMITTFFSILNGSLTTGVNIWNDYQVGTWILLIVILYPIYLVFVWEEEGFDAVISQLTFMFNVFMAVVHVFLTIIHYIVQWISNLVEAIPVAE